MMIIVIAVVLKAVVVILIVTVIILAKVIIIIVTKTAWAINTILGTRILYSGHSACVDPEVKRSRSHSYNNHHGCSWRVLLRPLPAWVCMPIRLPMFSSYKSVIEEFWRKAASHKDWMVPFTACRYWLLTIEWSFCSIHIALRDFQCAEQPPKLHIPVGRSRPPYLIMVTWASMSQPSKRHLDQLSHFCTEHKCNQQTHRPRYVRHP